MHTELYFILIQNREILDVVQEPSSLMLSLVDREEPWEVYIGCYHEERPEIVCQVARVEVVHNAPAWRVNSPLDGLGRLVSGGDLREATQFIRWRLSILKTNGYFDDLANVKAHVSIAPVSETVTPVRR